MVVHLKNKKNVAMGRNGYFVPHSMVLKKSNQQVIIDVYSRKIGRRPPLSMIIYGKEDMETVGYALKCLFDPKQEGNLDKV